MVLDRVDGSRIIVDRRQKIVRSDKKTFTFQRILNSAVNHFSAFLGTFMSGNLSLAGKTH